MKALITASGQFGPFSNIETLDDRYRCDGRFEFQYDVIGPATIGDYVAPPPSKEETNAKIKSQIANLEASVTPRRLREAIRGNGKVWLESLDDQIAALRGQLQ